MDPIMSRTTIKMLTFTCPACGDSKDKRFLPREDTKKMGISMIPTHRQAQTMLETWWTKHKDECTGMPALVSA